MSTVPVVVTVTDASSLSVAVAPSVSVYDATLLTNTYCVLLPFNVITGGTKSSSSATLTILYAVTLLPAPS